MFDVEDPDPERIAELVLQLVTPDAWLNADRDTRDGLLNQAFAALRAETSLHHVKLEVGDDTSVLSSSRRGLYDHGGPTVWIHRRRVDEDDPTSALGTLVHELRHAVQLHAVDEGPDGYNDALIALWQSASVVLWHDNADGNRRRYNALEVDAERLQHETAAAYWSQVMFP